MFRITSAARPVHTVPMRRAAASPVRKLPKLCRAAAAGVPFSLSISRSAVAAFAETVGVSISRSAVAVPHA
jgi:hypothetical protein